MSPHDAKDHPLAEFGGWFLKHPAEVFLAADDTFKPAPSELLATVMVLSTRARPPESTQYSFMVHRDAMVVRAVYLTADGHFEVRSDGIRVSYTIRVGSTLDPESLRSLMERTFVFPESPYREEQPLLKFRTPGFGRDVFSANYRSDEGNPNFDRGTKLVGGSIRAGEVDLVTQWDPVEHIYSQVGGFRPAWALEGDYLLRWNSRP
jgi:hypothetical protein